MPTQLKAQWIWYLILKSLTHVQPVPSPWYVVAPGGPGALVAPGGPGVLVAPGGPGVLVALGGPGASGSAGCPYSRPCLPTFYQTTSSLSLLSGSRPPGLAVEWR